MVKTGGIAFTARVLKNKFGEEIMFITTAKNKPQVAMVNRSQSTGELLHQSNREEILKQAAKILRGGCK